MFSIRETFTRKNNQNSDGGPSANLHFESLDNNLQRTGLEDNPLSYVSNYSPIGDQSDSLENLDSPFANNQEFPVQNDLSQRNRYPSLGNDDIYMRNHESEKFTGLENYDSRNRPNGILQSNQYGSRDPNRIYAGRYSMLDGSNSRGALKVPVYQNFPPNGINNMNDFRNNENFNYDQYGRGALYPRYRSGSIDPTKAQRLAERSEVSSSKVNAGSKTDTDSVKPVGEAIRQALRREPTIGSIDPSKQQGGRVSRVEKSEESMEKSVSGKVNVAVIGHIRLPGSWSADLSLL